MNFQPDLAAKVVAGTKTVTRRLVSNNPRSPWFVDRCSLRMDRAYAVCPGRGKNAIGRVVLTEEPMLVPLSPISHDEARLEGFYDATEFWEAFRKINGKVDPDEWVWRIAFRVLPAEDYDLWESGLAKQESLLPEEG